MVLICGYKVVYTHIFVFTIIFLFFTMSTCGCYGPVLMIDNKNICYDGCFSGDKIDYIYRTTIESEHFNIRVRHDIIVYVTT